MSKLISVMVERMIEEWPDDHWTQLMETILERVGEEKFIKFSSLAINKKDYTKYLELHKYPDAIKRSEAWKGIK